MYYIEIMFRAEKGENRSNFQYSIKGIESDMGEGTTLDLLIQGDGDACLTIWNKETSERLSIEICTSQGGTHAPGAALGLHDLAEFLYNLQEDPEFLQKRMMKLWENS